MSGDRLFHWPVVPLIIITLGVVASVGLVAKNLVPPRGDRSSVYVLDAWLGVWNPFYIWKDPDQDCQSREANK